MITYRKTGNGKWVAFGPVSEIKLGPVLVTKRDGSTKTETVVSLGKPFQADGKECVYGYLAERAPARRSYGWRGGDEECHTDGNCSSVCNPKTCPCGDGAWFRCC